jgi:hypothetical protein
LVQDEADQSHPILEQVAKRGLLFFGFLLVSWSLEQQQRLDTADHSLYWSDLSRTLSSPESDRQNII